MDDDQRFKRNLGFVVRWFGVKIILITLGSLFVLPSTWRFFAQTQPVVIDDPAALFSLPDDTWVKGRVVLDWKESIETTGKSIKRELVPVAGTGRSVFYEWKHRDTQPQGRLPIEVDGRIHDGSGFLARSDGSELRRQFIARGIELPERFVFLKAQPPPSLWMYAWRIAFHVITLGGSSYVVWRFLRALRVRGRLGSLSARA